MTTYRSDHTTYLPVIPGNDPFSLSDAYVLSGVVPTHEEVMASIEVDDEWLSWTDAIQEAPQTHAKGRRNRTPVPVRYVVMVFFGMVLMGLGLAREPIALLLWGMR